MPTDDPLGLLVEYPLSITPEHALRLPLFLCPVRAGFPSPADDYVEGRLDLNELVIRHPAATYFVRVEGASMTEANIHDGDIVVVDRAVTPVDGHIVVAAVDGAATVKIFRRRAGRVLLVSAHPDFPPIMPDDGNDFEIWGVVTYVIHPAASMKNILAHRKHPA